MKLWQLDKENADRFMHRTKEILGLCFFRVPAIEEDQLRNTDLEMMYGNLRIGCRIRKHEMLARYGDEFTIRTGRPSGVKTELDKIMDGWGDYLFYGFADEHDTGIAKWVLIDLDVFRCWHSGSQGMLKENHDGSSGFMAFDLKQVPVEMVFRSSEDFKSPEEILEENEKRAQQVVEMNERNRYWRECAGRCSNDWPDIQTGF